MNSMAMQNNYRESVHKTNWVMVGLTIATIAGCVVTFLKMYP